MMMATGCLQSQRCHTNHCHSNHCPVGVSTQDPSRARALGAEKESFRVLKFQESTVSGALRMMASVGSVGPDRLTPLMMRWIVHLATTFYAELHNWLAPR